jgi:hypothetical protein
MVAPSNGMIGIGPYTQFTVDPTATINPPTGRLPIWRQPSTIITNFQSGHGYTNNAGSTFTANFTGDFILGSQSTRIITGGIGAAANVSKAAGPNIDTTGKTIRLRLKVADITHMTGLNFFLGSSAFANNYKWIIQGGVAGSNHITSGEWIVVTLNWHDAVITGSPARNALTDVRFQVTDDSTSQVTVMYQSIELVADASATFPNGAVSICFDDCFQSFWDNGKPRMDQYGYPGSIYVIEDLIGGSGRLSETELRNLQERQGWEISSHANTDADHALTYTGMTGDQLLADLESMKGNLINGGYHGNGTAYPLGQYGLTADGVSTTSIVRKFYGYARHTNSKTKETFPPGDPYRLRAISAISSFAGGYAPANLTTAVTGDIDVAKANQTWLILVFHKVTTVTPTATTEIIQADFNSIIDKINAVGMPVIPVGDVLNYFT